MTMTGDIDAAETVNKPLNGRTALFPPLQSASGILVNRAGAEVQIAPRGDGDGQRWSRLPGLCRPLRAHWG